MPVKCERNCMVQTTRTFKHFDKNKTKQTNKQTKKQKKKQNKTKQTNKTKQIKQNKKTNGILKPLLTKRWRYFGKRFCSWNNCLSYY